MSIVTVVDYSNSNANSVLRALHSVGAEATLSSDPLALSVSDYIVMPGVGHAGQAMAALRSSQLLEPLEDAVLNRNVPVLGICLGMHIMVEHIDEGDCAGLGWIRGRAMPLVVEDRLKYKVPHIGWNTVDPQAGSRLFADPAEDAQSFYFCHKYMLEGVEDVGSLATFRYESEQVASFEKGNIFGVQFHPEKSHEAGLGLFEAFLRSGG